MGDSAARTTDAGLPQVSIFLTTHAGVGHGLRRGSRTGLAARPARSGCSGGSGCGAAREPAVPGRHHRRRGWAYRARVTQGILRAAAAGGNRTGRRPVGGQPMQADLDSSPRTADWWHTPTKHLL